jgi:cyclic pyranopterin phosphate synthase
MPMVFNHFDEHGQAVMVNITAKQPTLRCAIASARVFLSRQVFAAVLDGQVAKGDVLGVARLAGIAAAKKTPDLIPLSHPLALHHVAIEFVPDQDSCSLQIKSRVEAFERTGVEMEAMVAASVAALTVYDMCKGADKSIRIGDVELLFKEGGKSGVYRKAAGP